MSDHLLYLFTCLLKSRYTIKNVPIVLGRTFPSVVRSGPHSIGPLRSTNSSRSTSTTWGVFFRFTPQQITYYSVPVIHRIPSFPINNPVDPKTKQNKTKNVNFSKRCVSNLSKFVENRSCIRNTGNYCLWSDKNSFRQRRLLQTYHCIDNSKYI